MSQLIKYNSRGLMLAVVVVVGMAVLIGGEVLALDPIPSDPQPSSARLNQSVALDAVDAGGKSPQPSEFISGKPEVAVNASANHIGVAGVGSHTSAIDEAAREYLPPRDRRTGFRAGEKTLPAPDRSGPWYSTGIGALAVVFVVIGIVYVLVRKYMPGSVIVPCQGVKVIGRVALSPKHRAVLVKLGQRAILIGLGGDQMTTLAEITDQDEVARLSQESNPGTATMSPEFNSWLRREQADYGSLEDSQASSTTTTTRDSRRSPMGDLLEKLRSFQKSRHGDRRQPEPMDRVH